MNVLALDVGGTTGYAYLQNGGLELTGNLQPDDIPNSILPSLEVDLVIVEYPIPAITLPRSARVASRRIREMFPEALEVSPSSWKSLNYPSKFPFPREKYPSPTQHQMDAFWIGRHGISLLSIPSNPSIQRKKGEMIL